VKGNEMLLLRLL